MANPSFWSVALPTVAGALVGAAIGWLAIRWQFEHESKERAEIRKKESGERYEDGLTRDVAALLKEISAYANLLKSGTPTTGGEDFALITAIEIVRIFAKDKDLEMVKLIRKVFFGIRHSPSGTLRKKLGILTVQIGDWRSEMKPYQECFRKIGELNPSAKAQV